MYNKLFTKILDSSIWLEPTDTRIVWLTLIAVMDESGFAQFASIANLAHRARVSVDAATAAIACFENPDPSSSDPENEGKRVERVPGGWMVLNAQKHRDLVTREVIKEQTRERVRRFRERLKRSCNASVTTSDTDTDTDTRARSVLASPTTSPLATPVLDPTWSEISTLTRRSEIQRRLADQFLQFREAYPASRRVGGKKAMKAFQEAMKAHEPQHLAVMLAALEQHKRSEQWQTPRLIPLMTTWLNQERWNQHLPEPTGFAQAGKTAGNLSALKKFAGRKA